MTITHIEPTLRRGAAQPAASDELDFARLIGPAAWQRLAPAIRARFSAKPTAEKPSHYRGIMHEVRCSRAGWLLAQACRLFGTPFALHRGHDVPVTITLRALSSGTAMVWERAYHYPDHGTAIVRSEKREAADGTLTESVAAGFSMRLALGEAGGALHFRSLGYVFRIGGWSVPLPDLLSPGDAHVVHQDLGDGRFRFVMTIRHKLFGTLFHQDGVFHEEEPTP